MNNEYDEEVKRAAEEAFSNASRLTSNRLGPRAPSPARSESPGGSVSSRRSPSLIKTPDQAELFEVMSSATSVVLSKRKKSTKGNTASSPVPALPSSPSSPVQDILKGASSLFQSMAPRGAGGTMTPFSEKSAISLGSTGTGAMKHLDLANNDNSFHVIANLLVDFFQARVIQGTSAEPKLLLKPVDKEKLERILPKQARSNFIMAVQERLGNTPSQPSTPLQFLTLQCQELNLDQDDESNPLLAVLELTTEPVLIEVLPSSVLTEAMAMSAASAAGNPLVSPTASEMTGQQNNLSFERAVAVATPTLGSLAQADPNPASTTQAVAAAKPSFFGFRTAPAAATPAKNISTQAPTPVPVASAVQQTSTQKSESTQFPSPVPFMSPPQQQQPPGDASVVYQQRSGGVDPLISRPDPSGDCDSRSVNTTTTSATNTESLARRQLLAELREASNLMANSVTPETAKFWRDHVLELQARLRALHGEGTSVSGFSSQSPTPEDILESNRRLLSEFQQREQYVPPVIDSPLKSFDTPGSKSMEPVAPPPSTITPRKIDLTKTPTKTPPSKISLLKGTPQSNSVPPTPLSSSTPLPMSMGGGGGFDSTPVVDVVAPADLPGGYRFEAEIEGQRFLAVVPPGGVRQGDTFSCFMKELDSEATIDIPVGYWKDGVINWFKFGVCHQVVWNSIFCPLSTSFCFVSLLMIRL